MSIATEVIRSTGQAEAEHVQRLQSVTTAVRLHVRWPGVRKTLSVEQKHQAADAFFADQSVLSAAKKLLDTSHPAFRAVSAIRSDATDYWRKLTLPYVEPGIRLIPRQQINAFEEYMHDASERLSSAVANLDDSYAELVDKAREHLGRLFDPSDYPSSLSDQFAITWDYPSTQPPEYLRAISPEIYESECQRVEERFSEAVQIAELAFCEELRSLVSHLADRLSGDIDGKPKIFRDSALNNLFEFFERFERLNIRSDEQLDQLVAQARSVLAGKSPGELRDRNNLRQHVADQLGRIEQSLDNHLADKPRRNILRRASA